MCQYFNENSGFECKPEDAKTFKKVVVSFLEQNLKCYIVNRKPFGVWPKLEDLGFYLNRGKEM